MSSICQHFVQNAWKKDLCSNCFKSKEEHLKLQNSKKPLYVPKLNGDPPKGIIKTLKKEKSSKRNVSFPKELSEVIGFGGEWSDHDSENDDDFDEPDRSKSMSDALAEHFVDDPDPELIKITKTNTDFNTNNQNLMGKGKPEVKVKQTFASLKLGASQPKSPLQITVLPFGTTNKVSDMKQKFNTPDKSKAPTYGVTTTTINTTTNNTSTIKIKTESQEDLLKITVAEKSLLEEISETLEKNKLLNAENTASGGKSVATKKEISDPILINTTSTVETKRTLQRHSPIRKDQAKPKITVFPKPGNNSESSDGGNSSDAENVSAYYDVVCDSNNYENISTDEYDDPEPEIIEKPAKTNLDVLPVSPTKKKSFFSSQLISDMFLTKNKPISEHLRKRSETYNLTDRSYITSKITSDGLIVTKNNEDALDSSGSSFDSSSDEEMSSMNRSESDSGIGICVTTEYQNVDAENRIKEFNGFEITEKSKTVEKTNISSTANSSDYEDIQICQEIREKDEKILTPGKSRELAGEPDGRSDPDGSAEAPALPTSPPPNVDARKSFLHSLQQQKSTEKPKVPTKPTVSVIKTFAKRPSQITVQQQQVVMQMQQVVKQPETVPEQPTITSKQDLIEDIYKTPRKGRAPNPPPSPTKDDQKIILDRNDSSSPTSSISHEDESSTDKFDKDDGKDDSSSTTQSSLYTRNPLSSNIKSNSPVVREKDKRERATVNPKFRSLNTFSMNRSSYPEKLRPTTPEPAPRKSLSMSTDSLNAEFDKKKKNKFSIKKFLRMGSNSSSSTSNLSSGKMNEGGFISKKDGFYSEHPGCSSTDDNTLPHPQAKPRLVIIHPLDINNKGVEVIKDIKSSTPDSSPAAVNLSGSNGPTVIPVIGKPPAPPIRTTGIDGTRLQQEVVKPARPPPPKSAELRRKQKLGTGVERSCPDPDKETNKMDNVYANLGEVRSSIAPRKPERTASMRGEKDTGFDLTRRRPIGQYENLTAANAVTTSSCGSSDTSSMHDTLSTKESDISETESNTIVSRTSSDASDLSLPKTGKLELTTNKNHDNNNLQYNSFNERKRRLMEFEKCDLLQSGNLTSKNSTTSSSTSTLLLNDGIKNSVQKMSSTIDSYLKDKMASSSSSSAPSTMNKNHYQSNTTTGRNSNVNNDMMIELRGGSVDAVNGSQQQRSSMPEQNLNGYYGTNGGSVCDKNEIYSKKFSQVNLPRAISMSYCGSEIAADSEIYSPYSFCSSEAGTDVACGDPQDGWGGSGSQQNSNKRPGKTINRLRMRKGRSVVHKNLEDNYGAVVVANHEALAQVLEQLQQTTNIPIHLRPIANSMNLRFEDFALVEGARGVVVGRRAFHAATWPNHIQVTLALTADCNQMSGVCGELNQLSGGISGALNPITEFCDLVPSHYLPLMPSTQMRMIQATISVLPRMHIDTLQSLGSILKSKSATITPTTSTFGGSIPNLSSTPLKDQQTFSRNGNSVQNLTSINDSLDDDGFNEISGIPNSLGLSNFDEILFREVGFVMLQLINGLKSLQAKGIEEMPTSLSNVVLCKEVENKEAQARLCVLQGLNQDLGRDEEESMGTLCQCAHSALTTMLPQTKLTDILSKILLQEKSDSLSKAKSILEFAIWGPSDVSLTGSIKERELSLQRWLDLERATVLHGLVRTRVELTVYDECHLMFLVRSNAKIMCEALGILEANE